MFKTMLLDARRVVLVGVRVSRGAAHHPREPGAKQPCAIADVHMMTADGVEDSFVRRMRHRGAVSDDGVESRDKLVDLRIALDACAELAGLLWC